MIIKTGKSFQDKVFDLLERGKENAISIDSLVSTIFGTRFIGSLLKGRQIRKAIEQMREEGTPICSLSTHKGYWLAKNWEELDEFLAEYESRAYRILHTASRMRKAFREEYHQESFQLMEING